MTTFDERERGEEGRFKHELELGFKIRNRRNKMFGQWVAENELGLAGETAATYAREVLMADFELPGDRDMMGKVRQDLERAGKPVDAQALERRLHAFEDEARQQVMTE